jgi:hypothetical protein
MAHRLLTSKRQATVATPLIEAKLVEAVFAAKTAKYLCFVISDPRFF